MAKVSVQTLIDDGLKLASDIERLQGLMAAWVKDCADSIPEGAKADVVGFLGAPFPPDRVSEDVEVRRIVTTNWGLHPDMTRKSVDVLVAYDEQEKARILDELSRLGE